MWGKRANAVRPRQLTVATGLLVVLTGMIGPAPARAAPGDVGYQGPAMISAHRPEAREQALVR